MIATTPEYQQRASLDRARGQQTYLSTGSNPPEPSIQPKAFVARTIARYPVVVLASAGLVGIALGWLVKRRLK